jgi:UDP-N-acetyl-D-mannosaminuronic acid dehydrogenase
MEKTTLKKVCILGLGYIGLPTAAMFATHGFNITGVDINDKIIDILNKGNIHIEEPGLKTIVQAATRSGNLCINCTPEPADAFIIAVPTPFKHDEYGEYNGKRYKLADMSMVTAATESIVPHLRAGNLVILESTSPPRTTIDLVKPILESSGLKAGEDFYLAYSPERVLPGQILKELIENARVIGGINPESAAKGKELYSSFVKGEIVLTDATTAEMVKLMENAYRDVNIAIANEFSRLANKFGVDIWEAISIANLHPRVKILQPGPGVGGHCISVDPWFLVEGAPEISNLIWTARHVNDCQPAFVVETVKQVYGNLDGTRIGALGLSFKANVDDIRESPAIEVIRLLQKEGAIVKAYEPNKFDAQIPGITTTRTLEEAITGSDIIIFLAAHQQFLTLNPLSLVKPYGNPMVISAVSGLAAKAWKKAGFGFVQLGNGKQEDLQLDFLAVQPGRSKSVGGINLRL